VKSNGGTVHLIDLLAGLSTTAAIARVREGRASSTPVNV